ncbi:MAG: hypothetical protein ABI205_07690, partial [Gemmatimonadaceae bacterium]
MRPLDRLRRKVTVWYVATFGAILVTFSVGLFFAIRHNIALTLDRSLKRATVEVQRSIGTADDRSVTAGEFTRRASALRIPDRMLSVFAANGRLVYPDTASSFVRAAARRAALGGEGALQADIGHEHTLLVHASRFVDLGGDTLVAVAAADTEELEDEY